MDGLRFSAKDLLLNKGLTTSEARNSRVEKPSVSNGTDGESFAKTLQNAIGEVNTLQKTADVEMEKLATGRSDNIHDVMIAAEKADIALKLMVQMRNKIIEAYQEVMKMQV